MFVLDWNSMQLPNNLLVAFVAPVLHEIGEPERAHSEAPSVVGVRQIGFLGFEALMVKLWNCVRIWC